MPKAALLFEKYDHSGLTLSIEERSELRFFTTCNLPSSTFQTCRSYSRGVQWKIALQGMRGSVQTIAHENKASL